MRDTEITTVLKALDAAHITTGYASDTTFSKGAEAIRFLLRERAALQLDLHFQSASDEVTC